ncbi:hypothetical protein ElyMa_005021000 [Elysia marginata]|uniref:CTNNB1 binding N-teminal domain-containing protein n=1 Tax=Elysia marginata TaxID=1093978 RepID=A0AAV4J8K5_9GAST|nr:hypothetical protein ElyMa_005021000 [Elysia marginata]
MDSTSEMDYCKGSDPEVLDKEDFNNGSQDEFDDSQNSRCGSESYSVNLNNVKCMVTDKDLQSQCLMSGQGVGPSLNSELCGESSNTNNADTCPLGTETLSQNSVSPTKPATSSDNPCNTNHTMRNVKDDEAIHTPTLMNAHFGTEQQGIEPVPLQNEINTLTPESSLAPNVVPTLIDGAKETDAVKSTVSSVVVSTVCVDVTHSSHVVPPLELSNSSGAASTLPNFACNLSPDENRLEMVNIQYYGCCCFILQAISHNTHLIALSIAFHKCEQASATHNT